jgi:hypothetical protein
VNRKISRLFLCAAFLMSVLLITGAIAQEQELSSFSQTTRVVPNWQLYFGVGTSWGTKENNFNAADFAGKFSLLRTMNQAGWFELGFSAGYLLTSPKKNATTVEYPGVTYNNCKQQGLIMLQTSFKLPVKIRTVPFFGVGFGLMYVKAKGSFLDLIYQRDEDSGFITYIGYKTKELSKQKLLPGLSITVGIDASLTRTIEWEFGLDQIFGFSKMQEIFVSSEEYMSDGTYQPHSYNWYKIPTSETILMTKMVVNL